MARHKPDGLALRVVYVPGGVGAADARRRVVDVLLRAAIARAELAEAPSPTITVPEPPSSPHEKAA